jgi:K+-sensing histidine kinase KdpD
MRTAEFLDRHRSGVIAIAAVAPLAACALLVPFRDDVANTNAALGLVLLVVAAAATGIRPAGLVAAASSAAWFDFFLTEPYQHFAINDHADIETAVLLVLVGVAVTEVALWGRRQQAQASRQEGYLNGVVSTAGLVAAGRSSSQSLIGHVADQIVDILDIDACRFESVTESGSTGAQRLPRLEHDGTVTRDGRTVEVDRHGLPVDSEIELRVQHAGTTRGRFLLTASTRLSRPTAIQRQVAVTLADQVGSAVPTRADP